MYRSAVVFPHSPQPPTSTCHSRSGGAGAKRENEVRVSSEMTRTGVGGQGLARPQARCLRRTSQSHGEGRSNAAPLARRGSQQTFPSASPRRSDRPLAGRVLRRTQCRSSTRHTRGPPSRIVSGRNSPSRAPDVNPLGSNWPSSWRGCPPSRPRVVGDVSQRPREGTASSLSWLRRRDV